MTPVTGVPEVPSSLHGPRHHPANPPSSSGFERAPTRGPSSDQSRLPPNGGGGRLPGSGAAGTGTDGQEAEASTEPSGPAHADGGRPGGGHPAPSRRDLRVPPVPPGPDQDGELPQLRRRRLRSPLQHPHHRRRLPSRQLPR